MTTKAKAKQPLRGLTQPRVHSPLLKGKSRGSEVIEMVERLKMDKLMPYQEFVLKDMMAVDKKNNYRRKTSLLLISRQNGKSHLGRVRVIWGMFYGGEKKHIIMSSNRATALMTFREIAWIIESTPELKAMQDRVMALTGQGLTEAEQAGGRYAPLTAGAQGLFSLGQQYLAKSPEQAAADYMAKQQNLLAPSRERSMAQLQNQLYQQGRGGLSVGATSMRPSGAAGFGAASPEMEAYYNAMAQQDAQLAANAQQAGQQNVAFGAGLLGSGSQLMSQYQAGQVGALNPFTTYLGAGSTLEQLGQQPLEMGSALGGRSASAGANVGRSLLESGTLAAQSNLAAARNAPSELLKTGLTGLTQNPQFWSGVGNWWNTPSGTTTTNAFFP